MLPQGARVYAKDLRRHGDDVLQGPGTSTVTVCSAVNLLGIGF